MDIRNQANLSKSINRLANNNNPTDMHTGWLGNGQGIVLVPNSTNGTEVYVRIVGQSGVKIAFNSVVPNADNLPVEIGYFPSNPIKLQIIRQLSYFPSLQVNPVPSANMHHQQHEYGGWDQVTISKRQYAPFRLNSYGFLVIVSPDYLYTNNQWNLYYPTGATDLSGLVPSSGSRYVLVSVSGNGIDTDFSTGTVSGVLSLADIPPLPYGDAPVAAVKLYTGQTGIYEYTDILDLRGNPFIGISGSYSGGLYSGSYGDMYRSTYDPAHNGYVNQAGYALNSDKLDGHHWSEITGSYGGGTGSSVTVADTSTIDLTLTGQQISGVVIPSGITLDTLGNPTDNTTLNVTTGSHGLAPKGHVVESPAKYWREDWTLAVPSVTGSSGSGGFIDPHISSPGNTGEITLLSSIITITDDSRNNAFPGFTKMSNDDFIAIYRDATLHVGDKGTISMKTSSDKGVTWSSESTLYSDATYDVRDPNIICLSTGRLVVSFFKYNHITSTRIVDGCFTTYSDNNGSTWSTPVQIDSLFTGGSSCSSPAIELSNGNLLQAMYSWNSGDTYSSVSVVKSTDYGVSWGSEIVVCNGQTDGRYYQEPNLVFLHDGRVLCMIRSDTPNQASGLIWKSYSSDLGAIWSTPISLWSGTGSPRTIQLKNGMLLYINRRTSDNLGIWRISRDAGYTWIAEADFDVRTPSDSLSYASAYEYEEGLIGVVYGWEIAVDGTNSDILFKRFYTTVESGQLVSHVPTGVAPISVQSETTVTHLNSDLLDGHHWNEITGSSAGLSTTGWIDSGQTWTYEATDAPTYTFSESIDATGKYSIGMKIKCTQGGSIQYGIITNVGSYSGGKTIITVYCGTDYSLGATITSPYYSTSKSPFGFPLDITKWTVSVVDTTEREHQNPTAGTVYNLGSIAITIPIGAWKVSYDCALYVSAAVPSDVSVYAGLSTANNSFSDSLFMTFHGGNAALYLTGNLYKQRYLILGTKTVYYLNAKTTASSMSDIDFRNDLKPLVLEAVCIYL